VSPDDGEPRSNITFASQLLDEGKSPEEIIELLEERGLSKKEARRILRKLERAEARPSPVLAFVLIALGASMALFGAWVIINAYNDPEVMQSSRGFIGHQEYELSGGPVLLRRMWRVTLMCWACGGLVLGMGAQRLWRANAKAPPKLTPLKPPPGYEKASIPDMKRYATKELVKGKAPEVIAREIMGMGAGQELAKKIVGIG
jgi:hypothetical protein